MVGSVRDGGAGPEDADLINAGCFGHVATEFTGFYEGEGTILW